MDVNIKDKAASMKLSSYKMASLSLETRNNALRAVADSLIANMDEIVRANEADLKKARGSTFKRTYEKRIGFGLTSY